MKSYYLTIGPYFWVSSDGEDEGLIGASGGVFRCPPDQLPDALPRVVETVSPGSDWSVVSTTTKDEPPQWWFIRRYGGKIEGFTPITHRKALQILGFIGDPASRPVYSIARTRSGFHLQR